MSKSLEARVSKLEEQIRPPEQLTVILVRFPKADNGRLATDQGTLIGYESGGYREPTITTARRPGESDDDLIERAKLAANQFGHVIVLRELRL